MKLKIGLGVFAFLIILSGFVLSSPPLFHEFYGGATCVNGDPFSEDASVLIKINGVDYGTITVSGGSYHVIISAGASDVGLPVEFYSGDELLGSDTFESFGFTRLDLLSNDNGLCGAGGGGGESPAGGGGGGGSGGGGGGGSAPAGETCNDDCVSGKITCLDSARYIVCGDYDADDCSEWSGELNCDKDYACEDNVGCVALEGGDGSPFGIDITGGAVTPIGRVSIYLWVALIAIIALAFMIVIYRHKIIS